MLTTLLAAAVWLLPAGSAAAVTAPRAGSATGTIDQISCTWAGTCTAVGDMALPSRKPLFAVSEKRGIWGTAQAIPGIAALLGRSRYGAYITDLSCPSAGNCGAGGYYGPGSASHAFVVTEKNGTWRKAGLVPGLAKLNVGKNARIGTLSCPWAGNCSAGGTYASTRHHIEVFVVSQKHGTWGKAEEVPGTARLNTGGDAGFTLTCPSAGNCLGVGSYTGPKGAGPFAVTEKNGRWGTARAFPRIIARSPARVAFFDAAWCKTTSNCLTMGGYLLSPNAAAVFAIREKNGIWGPITPIRLPITAASGRNGPQRGDAAAASDHWLSCSSPGNCTTGGDFLPSADPELSQPWVVTEKNGTWGNARTLPGVAAMSANSGTAYLGGVTCRSAGNCSAAGAVMDANPAGDAVFLSTEKGGIWGQATELRLPAPPQGKPLKVSPPVLACGAPGNCSLGGWYSDTFYPFQTHPYLATQKNGIWGKAQPVKGTGP